MMHKNPKVSVITACYNSEQYIEDCIRSIMGQTYDNVEHIIIDGGSCDRTLSIIQKYDGKYNMKWISEKDEGMYDAICKGFAMATGEIFAWLNSDDMYMPWACEIVAKVMEQTDVQWCTGIPCHYTERGIAYNIPRVTPVFPQKLIAKGYMDGRVASFLEQESMFWSKELWNKSGNIIRQYKIAGDFHLWKKFAKYEKLITLDSVISGFRIHEGQKSENRDKYYAEVGELTPIGKIWEKTRVIDCYLRIYSLFSKTLRIRTRQYLNGGEAENVNNKQACD